MASYTLNSETHIAILQALSNSVALSGLVADRIYDYAPPDVVYPYIQMGDLDIVDHYDEGAVWDVTANLYAYSVATSSKEIIQIKDAIHEALEQPLLMTNFWCGDWKMQRIKSHLDLTGKNRQFEAFGFFKYKISSKTPLQGRMPK